jgi:hypothetical protein
LRTDLKVLNAQNVFADDFGVIVKSAIPFRINFMNNFDNFTNHSCLTEQQPSIATIA